MLEACQSLVRGLFMLTVCVLGLKIHLAMNTHSSHSLLQIKKVSFSICKFSFLVSLHPWSFINFNDVDKMKEISLFWFVCCRHALARWKKNRLATIFQKSFGNFPHTSSGVIYFQGSFNKIGKTKQPSRDESAQLKDREGQSSSENHLVSFNHHWGAKNQAQKGSFVLI